MSSWTVSSYLNAGITYPPASVTDLMLQTGGSNKTSAVTGTTLTQIPAGLTSAATLRYPEFGSWSSVVNSLGKNGNVNLLAQSFQSTAADVDPADGKIHVRFTIAPVLENPVPAHPNNQQPYFYVVVRNTTKSTVLFSAFNFSNQPGVPWQSNNGALYTDWQLVDVAPGTGRLDIGDTVKVEVYASGCSPGGHFGEVYVDAFGAFIPGLALTASGPQAANSNTNITYHYLITNGGGVAATNTTLTSVLPTNTTFVSVSPPAGITCSTPAVGATGTVTCNLGSLNPTASTTIDLTVKVASGATGKISHGNYSVRGDANASLLGPLIETNITTSVTYADLVTSLTDGVAAVGWGGSVQYTATVTNNGPSAVVNAPVTDTLPAQLTGSTWTCSGGSGGSCAAASGSGSINTTVSLPNGASATFVIDATVVAGSGTGTLIYTFSASTPSGVTDSDTNSNSATDVDSIGTLRTLTVQKTSSAPGTVVSSPAAISCGIGCASASASFADGSLVSLTATAASGGSFIGWSNACSGTTPTCNLTLSAAATAVASFGWNVAGSAASGGGTVSCTTPVVPGGSSSCTLAAGTGYVLTALTDNGTDVLSAVVSNAYGLTNINEAHAVVATFKKLAGVSCGATVECAAGVCADGVCCNSACTGICQACNVTGSLGTCSFVAGSPASGHGACTTDGTSCGGSCSGSSISCTYPGSGTVCRTAGCTSGAATLAASCAGTGNCPSAVVQSCAPFACGATSCLQSCSAGSDCSAGNYCGSGNNCVVKIAQGGSCSADAQCQSSHCVDGFCCNSACAGQCEACDAAGIEGTCSAVNGVPHGGRTACTTDGSACAGSCNGVLRVSCSYPGGSTNCRSASCASGTATLSAACTGGGTCPALQTQTCAPYICGSTACAGNCGADGDCASGNYCAGGVCVPLIVNGTACSGDNQCQSNKCVDGTCCNAICAGQCQACDVAGAVGTCTAVTGIPHNGRPACATDGSACGGTCDGALVTACSYPTSSCRSASCASGTATLSALCDGAGTCPAVQTQACAPYICGGAACAGNCAADTDCSSGNYCSAGLCVAKLALGNACSGDNQCQSSECVDGFCCNVLCDGQCQACDAAGVEGTCTPVVGAPHHARPSCAADGTACDGACDGVAATACTYPGPTTTCLQASCTAGIATLQANCDGAGSCPALQTQSCASFVCGSTACRGDCVSDLDCASENYCSAGICVPKKSISTSCAASNQCSSGHCSDGFCCDQACGGACQACDAPGATGTCSPVTREGDCGFYACLEGSCRDSCQIDGDCIAGGLCLKNVCTARTDLRNYHARGSGCSTGSSGGGFALAGLMVALFLGQWRGSARPEQRQNSQPPRGPNKWLYAVAAMFLLVVQRAEAQSLDRSFSVDRFTPGVGAYDILGVQSADVAEHLKWGATLYGNYARRPLRLVSAFDSDFNVDVVRSQTVLDVGGYVGLFGWGEVSAVLPVVVVQQSGNGGVISPELNRLQRAGLGDLRIIPKATFLRSEWLRLGASLPITLPTAQAETFFGHHQATVALRALADVGRREGPRLSANAGVVLRSRRQFVDIDAASAFEYGVGAEFPLDMRSQQFAVLATLTGARVFRDSGSGEAPLELLGALRWLLPKGWAITLGGGPGITSGYGTPTFRILGAVSWSPGCGCCACDHMEKSAAVTPVATTPITATVVAAPLPAPSIDPVSPPSPALPAATVPAAPPPPPQIVKVTVHKLEILSPIAFENNSDVLVADSFPILEQVATALRANPDIELLRVEGHSDNKGAAAHNLSLSKRRATRVRSYLIEKGIDANRLTADGYGASRPLVPNATAPGRAKNRRVEFVVIRRKGTP